jgi:hypothetical protein
MTGTRAPLKIIPTHQTTSSGNTGGVLHADVLASPKPKLLDQLREALRSRHYSRRTEQTYILYTHVSQPWADRRAQSGGYTLTESGGFYADPYNYCWEVYQ